MKGANVLSALGFLIGASGIVVFLMNIVPEFIIPNVFGDEHVSGDILLDDPMMLLIPVALSLAGVIVMCIGIAMFSAAAALEVETVPTETKEVPVVKKFDPNPLRGLAQDRD